MDGIAERRRIGAACRAEREVDHLRAVGSGPGDPVGDVGVVGAAAPGCEDAHHDQRRGIGEARDADRVVGLRAGDPGDVRAVAVVVGRHTLGARVVEAGRAQAGDARRKIRMGGVDAGVDDPDRDGRARREGAGEDRPAAERGDGRERPLVAVPGVARRAEVEQVKDAVGLGVEHVGPRAVAGQRVGDALARLRVDDLDSADGLARHVVAERGDLRGRAGRRGELDQDRRVGGGRCRRGAGKRCQGGEEREAAGHVPVRRHEPRVPAPPFAGGAAGAAPTLAPWT